MELDVKFIYSYVNNAAVVDAVRFLSVQPSVRKGLFSHRRTGLSKRYPWPPAGILIPLNRTRLSARPDLLASAGAGVVTIYSRTLARRQHVRPRYRSQGLHQAAVDHDIGAGDPPGLTTQQESNKIRHRLRLAHPPQ